MAARARVKAIEFDPRLCKGCRICIALCPVKIIVLSDRIGAYGTSVPEVRDVSKCIGCGFCELYCPDYAVTVVKEPRVKEEVAMKA